MDSYLLRSIFRPVLLSALLLTGVILAACNGEPQASPGVVEGFQLEDLDQTCRSAVNMSFQSEDSIYLGEAQGGAFYGPILVSFLTDGRVFWRYKAEPVFGTFTCQDGFFEAVFEEGDRSTLAGEFDPDNQILIIDGERYYPDTDV